MGFIILLLVYALAVISGISTKNFFVKTDKDDLTTQEVKDMVLRTQDSYKDKALRGKKSRVAHCTSLSKDLAYSIAVRYYPKSKQPFLELSINEITLLTGYITERVDEILNHRGIKMLRKLKVSTIVDLTNKKKELDESKVFQTSLEIGKNVNKAKNILNIINPINWGRKLIVDRIINLIIDRICLVIISIVGEETYKIYSKKVFNKDVNIDTGSQQFLSEMEESIKNAAIEMELEPEIKDNQVRFKSRIPEYKHFEHIVTYDEQIPLKSKHLEVKYEKE